MSWLRPAFCRRAWCSRRANVWAYLTIPPVLGPSVIEILLLESLAIEGELMRSGADGEWPDAPMIMRGDEGLELASIGFRATLRSLYRTTNLID